MCLAIPALLVEKRPHDQALVELGGIRKPISIALVPEANVGDYVICLLYTSPSPRDQRGSRMPSSA